MITWRVAEDPRTKSLIVRGPEKVIDIAADLVAVLDLPADKPMPTVKNLRAYKLKHAKAEELNAVLTNLELDARIVPVDKGNILIVSGAEDVMKEIDGVVEALDIDVPEPKNAPEPDKKEIKKDK
jgi:type II secretory pathway component GspD/PulD (secretin)